MKLVLVLVVICLVGAAVSKSTGNKRSLDQHKKRAELKKLLGKLLDGNDKRSTGNRRGVKKVNAARNHRKRDDDDEDDWDWDGCAEADTGLKDLLTSYISATVQEPDLDEITSQLSAKKKRRRIQRKRRSTKKRDDDWEWDDWFDMDDNFYCLSDRFYLMTHIQQTVNGIVCPDDLNLSSSMFDDLLGKIYNDETFTTLDVVDALKDLVDQNSGEDFFCVMEYGWDEIWDAIWPWEWK